jgi:putative ABC transport system permease protein
MEIKESFIMAANAVKANKLRSVLTLFGIAVGVFSVIAVMTAMNALQYSIENGMSQLGANTFQVQKFPSGFHMGPGAWDKYRNRKDLKYNEGMEVKEKSKLALHVGMEAWTGAKIVKSAKVQTNPNVSVNGEDPEGLITNDYIVEFGRGITESDLELSRRVAVIGKKLATKLFPNSNPIGQDIRIDESTFTVIGIFQEKGGLFGGGGVDEGVCLPLTTFLEKFGKERSINIMVQAKNKAVYQECIEEVTSILRTIRKVRPGAESDFEIFSNETLIRQFNDLTKYIKLGVTGISFIALIAAGIGIMNIMLISVTERTREIGIRKSIGAKKSNILSQFLMEAIILSEFGGLVGILLGVIVGNILASLMSIPGIIPVDWVIIGLVICSMVGVGFGVYPAWKAANLDPIESLRYE